MLLFAVEQSRRTKLGEAAAAEAMEPGTLAELERRVLASLVGIVYNAECPVMGKDSSHSPRPPRMV